MISRFPGTAEVLIDCLVLELRVVSGLFSNCGKPLQVGLVAVALVGVGVSMRRHTGIG